MALIEICRQACFVVAHTQFGVPLEGNGYQFLFQELDANLLMERSAIFDDNYAGQPVRLVVKSTIEREWKKRSGVTYGLLWFYALATTDGVEIAHIRIRQTWLERGKWREIRQIMKRERNIAPDMAIPPAPRTELKPAEVARINPHNIVLHSLRLVDIGRYEAMARIDTRHPVLFDRATEHIYAMIQIEVSRQMALYAMARIFDVDAVELDVWKCKSTFETVGELQLPTKATANVRVDDRDQLNATVFVTVSQLDRTISTFEIGVRRMT
ncbi:hypothetical protein ASC93_04385 [Massilia sp. Root335]|nr:hypothetical protein ASC93_04385 [Massilia sp. Root335]